jgi:TolA-binding protein
VDTLTAQEKINRNPVILKAELDSLIKQFNDSQPQQVVKEPVKETTDNTNQFIMAGLFAIITLLGFVIYMFYRHQHKINRTIAGLNEKAKQTESGGGNAPHVVAKEKKGKSTPQSLESKINDLNAELNKLSKENEGLNRVIKEYNGIQHEYDSLKHGILKAYKVKNYPGYDKTKDEMLAMQGVLQTENSVAAYAYEKFLKPILAITNANKNSPAKINAAEQEKLLDLLVSLSLLYIEYLYLRVNDLSIGGKMVERIQGLSKGNGLDATLLKKLNTEFGSRALVIKMVLDRVELHQLSYPVFDETNLNNQ